MSKEPKSTENLLSQIEKKNGFDKTVVLSKDIIPSGSYQIDRATGAGGYKRGIVVEVFGPESSGKSTIVLHAIREHQKALPERKVALIDFEHSFDPEYALAIGINVNDILVYYPESQEQGYDMIIDLITNDICSLIVIDSHTAAAPQKIVEGEMSDVTMGLQARNNSKFLLKVKGLLAKHQTTLIGVSQLRASLNSMGEQNITTGGNAWKFYSDMRFKVWKSADKEKELNRTTLEVAKNKCGKPWGKAEFDIVWGEGIDNIIEILDLAVEYKIVNRAGSWYSYNETKLGQGASNVKVLLSENPELFNEIVNQVISKKE